MKLRILSYNIHKCIGGLDRRYRPERIVETIQYHDPDILLLQEVDSGAKRSQGHRQVELLADMLGMEHHCWFPIVKVRGGGHHGNAILSRYNLGKAQHHDITTRMKKNRGVVSARHVFDAPHEDDDPKLVHIYNMHLGLAQYERKLQLKRFLESKALRDLHEDTPVIIGGDLNDVYGNLGRKLFEPAGFRTIPKLRSTFPAYAPIRALDGLYLRGKVDLIDIKRSDYKLARRASDHLPLIADVELH